VDQLIVPFKIWRNCLCISTLSGHFGSVNSLALHDGNLCSISNDRIKIWTTGGCLYNIVRTSASVGTHYLSVLTNGYLCYSNYKKVEVLRVDKGIFKCINTITVDDVFICTCMFASTDGYLYCGLDDGSIQILE